MDIMRSLPRFFCFFGVVSVSGIVRADVFEMASDGNLIEISRPAWQPEASPALEQGNISGLQPQAAPTASQNVVRQHIQLAAARYNISSSLVDAVAWQESRYNPRARSTAGAIGVMQLMPGTARQLGVRNPHDVQQNVIGGAAYLREQLERFGNNVPLALAAYNAGPGAVMKYGGIPPYRETQNYVRQIMRRMSATTSINPKEY